MGLQKKRKGTSNDGEISAKYRNSKDEPVDSLKEDLKE
jgi:hypothetical protein